MLEFLGRIYFFGFKFFLVLCCLILISRFIFSEMWENFYNSELKFSLKIKNNIRKSYCETHLSYPKFIFFLIICVIFWPVALIATISDFINDKPV